MNNETIDYIRHLVDLKKTLIQEIDNKILEFSKNKELNLDKDLDFIFTFVSNFTRVDKKDICSKAKSRRLVDIRFLFLVLARETTLPRITSNREIADVFGMNHSIVNHALKTVYDVKELKEEYETLKIKYLNFICYE